MVRILLGNKGSGKSTRIISALKQNAETKKRAFLIVPEQKTLICERIIAEQLSPDAQLYIEAVNFTRLANKVFREYGGLKYNYINAGGKNLIMYRAICACRNELSEYDIKKGREKGSVSLFLSAVSELKAYGITPKRFEESVSLLESSHQKKKLSDLALVYKTYEGILSDSFSDPYDDMMALDIALKEHPFFEGCDVYIDDFHGFTGAQFNILYSIVSQADNVTVAFDMPSYAKDGKMQYLKLAKTYSSFFKMCRRLGKKVEEVSFNEDHLHETDALSYLNENIWNFSAKSKNFCEGVSLVLPNDEFDECEYVASKISSLIMQGERYSDIAVIMRSCDTYRGIIDTSFEKYGIPYYFSTRTDITAKPLIKTVFSAIRAVEGYKAQDIVSYMKCGYADITDAEADELEEYIYRWNIYGRKFLNDDYWSSNPDGYVSEMSEYQIKKLERINLTRKKVLLALRVFHDAFEKLEGADSICVAVYKLLEQHRIKKKLMAEIADAPKDEAIEISQIYNVFLKALDTVSSVMGSIVVSPEDFEGILRYALEGVNVGSIPTGEDKVTVGEASGLRTDTIKHVFVLGVTEGAFPQSVQSSSFFTDTDKILLESYGIMLSENDEIKADNELLNFKNSICCASRSVCVLSPQNDIVGNKKEPSIAFNRIKALLPSVRIIMTSSLPIIDKIYTREIAKEYAGYISNPSTDAIREALGYEKYEFCNFSNESSDVGKKSAEKIFGEHMYLSQSKIESFVKCKFQYYCKYLLKLKSGARISFQSRDVGYLSHAVFEKFLKRIKEGKLDFSEITDSEIEKLVDEIIEEYTEAICTGNVRSAKIKHLFSILRSNLIIFIKSTVEEFAQSEFSPEYFELSFSGGDGMPKPLKFKVGEKAKIILSGVADRVDIYRKNGICYVRVVDYKSGSKKFSYEEVKSGLNMQMLIYLFTLCKMDECEFKTKLLSDSSEIRPAGILYFPMRIGKEKSDLEADLSSSEIESIEKDIINKNIKRNGVFLDDIEVLEAQEKELSGKFIPKYPSRAKDVFVSNEKFEEYYSELESIIGKIGSQMLEGQAQAVPLVRGDKSPCDYCEHRAVCRRRSK
ncbi:MAG: PD-(D/E)XK nuclease family protein [Clostridia bacterium]|nr:PD-(D/E)XK nuclease family protein [Clostridia bacterium]